MSTTTNLGITKLEVGQAQKEATINAALDTLDGQIGGAWTAWTPTWTNLSVGNGTVVAKYSKQGKQVAARLSLVFGSTTSISGSVSFSLPVTRAANAGTAGITPQGQSRLLDSSAGQAYEGLVFNTSTTTSLVTVMGAAGTYVQAAALSSTIPFTWAVSDEIVLQVVYEAA